MSIRLKYILFSLILFSSLIFCQVRKTEFSKLTIKDGLSQNTVSAVLQDNKGFMWIGTYYGLNKFDGYSFKIFDSESGNPHAISNRKIYSLAKDSSGNIWIGTSDGLNCYNPSENKFDNYLTSDQPDNPLKSSVIRAVTVSKSNDVWVGGENHRVVKYSPKNKKFVSYDLSKSLKGSMTGEIISLSFNSNGSLLIGYSDKIAMINPATGEVTEIIIEDSVTHNELYQVTDLLVDSKNGLWIGTRGEGVLYYPNFVGNHMHFNESTDAEYQISDNYIHKIYEDRTGTIWIATDNGLNKFDTARKTLTTFFTDRNDPLNISDNAVLTVFEDNSGILWFGTRIGGISMIKSIRKNFEHFTHIPNKNSLSNPSVYSIVKDKEGDLWIGTLNGLNKYESRADKFTNYFHDINNINSISSNRVWYIYPEKETYGKGLWIGTGEGLDYYDLKSKRFSHYKKTLSDKEVFSIYNDSRNYLWIGTDNGLNILDRKTGNFTCFLNDPNDPKSISNSRIWNIFEDSGHNLWIGTAKGLNKFNYSDSTFKSYLHSFEDPHSISDSEVMSILESRDGYLWFGTSNGLNRFDKSDGSFKSFNENDGFADHVIYSILEDNNGSLWIGTNKGLSKFNPKSGLVVNYNQSDGLQSDEFNFAAFKDESGRLYFGGIAGYNVFYPDSIKATSYKAPTVLTDLKLFNESIPVNKVVNGRIVLSKSIEYSHEVNFKYNQNLLTFDFACLDYNYPGMNLYSYKMDGVDHNWSKPNRNSSVTYNLVPGEYIFMVKGCNNDGIWNNEAAVIKIIISPPWWQTWIFRIIAAMILSFIFFALYTYRVRYIKNQKEKLEKLDISNK